MVRRYECDLGNAKKADTGRLEYVHERYADWTLDAGAFFVVREHWWKRGANAHECHDMWWYWQGDYEDGVQDMGYRELYVRWLEYAAFLPVFRSHGTDTPREIWNLERGRAFYDACQTIPADG